MAPLAGGVESAALEKKKARIRWEELVRARGKKLMLVLKA